MGIQGIWVLFCIILYGSLLIANINIIKKLKPIKLKKILILLSINLVFIVSVNCAIYKILDKQIYVKEWSGFEKQMKNKYPYIKNVDLDGYNVNLQIEFNIRGEMSIKDAEKQWRETQKFILSKPLYNELQKSFYEVKGSYLHKICISFYNHKEDKLEWRFDSKTSGDCEDIPEPSEFLNWEVEDGNGNTKEFLANE